MTIASTLGYCAETMISVPTVTALAGALFIAFGAVPVLRQLFSGDPDAKTLKRLLPVNPGEQPQIWGLGLTLNA